MWVFVSARSAVVPTRDSDDNSAHPIQMKVQSPQRTAERDTVKIITEFLADDMARVDRILCESLDDSESDLIREVGEYIAFTRGKKLRPMLTILTARSLGPDRAAPIEVAAAIELIHVATLLHDDVIDKASTRRGRPSVNARWGNDVAILMADYLYARAFDLALTALKPEVLRLLCRITQRMCEGEMYQIKLRGRDQTAEDYIHVVERKTGALFSACLALGALMAGRDKDAIALGTAFGYDFGVAFQITDDVLDFIAHHKQWGKDIGMDVSSGKQTLPLLYAMEDASHEDLRFMRGWLENGHDFERILETIQRYRGVERALDEARKYASRAMDHLAAMKPMDIPAHEHLTSLPEYVISRTF